MTQAIGNPGLTPARIGVLEAIFDAINTKGFSPSFDEIGQTVGLRSLATVSKHIEMLEQFGYLNKLRYRARTIEVTPRGILAVGRIRKARKQQKAEFAI